jgi:hypothetical protein
MNEQSEVARLVDEAQRKTRKMPELALSHAMELDRKLRLQKIDYPVTYCATDWVSSRSEKSGVVLAGTDSAPMQTLWRSEQLRRAGEEKKAAAVAFQSARAAEIPALNLLYANLSLDSEAVWLEFLNKYLAHRAAIDDRSAQDYALKLDRSVESRFSGLTLSKSPEPTQHNGPKISVLMPIYNAERTLQMAAESILNQTWKALELILIDDSSTDDSLAIAHKLKQKDPRVRVLELTQNGGPYIARNTGAQQATGEYITVHDADDWALPTRLADQISELRKTRGASVGMGHMLRIQDDGLVRRLQPTGWITPDGGLRLCFPSMLFEQTYFRQKLGAWDSVKAGADLEIFHRIKRFDPKALAISTKLTMLQLDHPASLTSSPKLYNDERGISEWRLNYQREWIAKHQSTSDMRIAPFPYPE